MLDGNFVINFGDLVKFVIVLIEKVLNVIGVFYELRRICKKVEVEVEVEKIKVFVGIELNEI